MVLDVRPRPLPSSQSLAHATPLSSHVHASAHTSMAHARPPTHPQYSRSSYKISRSFFFLEAPRLPSPPSSELSAEKGGDRGRRGIAPEGREDEAGRRPSVRGDPPDGSCRQDKATQDCRSAAGASAQVRSGCGEPREDAGLPPSPWSSLGRRGTCATKDDAAQASGVLTL